MTGDTWEKSSDPHTRGRVHRPTRDPSSHPGLLASTHGPSPGRTLTRVSGLCVRAPGVQAPTERGHSPFPPPWGRDPEARRVGE